MNEPNNTNNDYVGHYSNVHYQLCYPKDFIDNTNPPTQTPLYLPLQSHTRGFRPSATSFPLPHNVDTTAMDIMNYENAGNYTANYAPYPSVSFPSGTGFLAQKVTHDMTCMLKRECAIYKEFGQYIDDENAEEGKPTSSETLTFVPFAKSGQHLDEELSILCAQLAERTEQLNEAQKQLLSRKSRPLAREERHVTEGASISDLISDTEPKSVSSQEPKKQALKIQHWRTFAVKPWRNDPKSVKRGD
ncbi:4310_t:CDS:2 [Paraglomus brasilianum]|uniref:4310_t:CDS:1 n=1 Tax=Paraglomus brasilianum TaxID=144538 RepID=A0A9N9GBM9_9GLOM|nr:4310_t:CDS:2 [Paraglomus brasilianum]